MVKETWQKRSRELKKKTYKTHLSARKQLLQPFLHFRNSRGAQKRDIDISKRDLEKRPIKKKRPRKETPIKHTSVPGNSSRSRSCTLGIREEPPTKSTWSMSRAYMPPCTYEIMRISLIMYFVGLFCKRDL